MIIPLLCDSRHRIAKIGEGILCNGGYALFGVRNGHDTHGSRDHMRTQKILEKMGTWEVVASSSKVETLLPGGSRMASPSRMEVLHST